MVTEKQKKNLEIGKFKPGESGNPLGHPKGQKNYKTLYREALIKIAKSNGKEVGEIELDIVMKGLFRARDGNFQFYKDVMDRIHGQAKESVDLNVKDKVNETLSKEQIEKLNKIIKLVKRR